MSLNEDLYISFGVCPISENTFSLNWRVTFITEQTTGQTDHKSL